MECEANDATHSAAGANIDVPTTGATGVELVSVALVTPGSNPGFVFEPTSIPPTVLRAHSISPALPGDIVVAVDGIDVSNMAADAARALLTNHRPGERAAVSVLRAGQPLAFRITLE